MNLYKKNSFKKLILPSNPQYKRIYEELEILDVLNDQNLFRIGLLFPFSIYSKLFDFCYLIIL